MITSQGPEVSSVGRILDCEYKVQRIMLQLKRETFLVMIDPYHWAKPGSIVPHIWLM